MNTKDQCENLNKRFQAAGEWIILASEHSDIAVDMAKKKHLQKHALYHVQQSMETAAKGLAIGAGVSHDEVRKHSHDYPYLFFLLAQKIIPESDGIQYANELLAPFYTGQGQYDVQGQLGGMLNLPTSPRNKKLNKTQKQEAEKFFDALLQFPPEGVEIMLDKLAELNQNMRQALNKGGPIAEFINEPFVLEPSRSEGSFAQSIYRQLVDQARMRPGGRKLSRVEIDLLERLARQTEANLRSEYTEEQIWKWLDAQGGKLSVNANQIEPGLTRFFDMQSVLAGILILGSLVWPHESYPRYPAPPNAPDSLDEAAKRTRGWRNMGTKHYTEDLGVIKHIKTLAAQAKNTTTLLKRCYDNGYLLASLPKG